MGIKKSVLLFIFFPLVILSLGMSCAPFETINYELREITLRSMVEESLGDFEFAYESKDSRSLIGLLDNKFEARERFKSVLDSYFLSVISPHIHFVTDMVVADKSGINVRLHWLKKAQTASGVAVRFQGSSQFVFKKYPEGLKLMRIRQENPFF